MSIVVTVFDNAAPNKRIFDEEQKNLLLNSLFEMMYRDLMSDQEISPKFERSIWMNGDFRLFAIDKHSADCIVDIVERMPPPWDGADIACEIRNKDSNRDREHHMPVPQEAKTSRDSFQPPPRVSDRSMPPQARPRPHNEGSTPYQEQSKPHHQAARPYHEEPRPLIEEPRLYHEQPRPYHDERSFNPMPQPSANVGFVDIFKPPGSSTVVVEAFVAGELVYKDEFLHSIFLFDNRIRTDQWQVMGFREHGQGHVYTFTIQQSDFDVLNLYDGFIPYHGMQVEFRVLAKPPIAN